MTAERRVNQLFENLTDQPHGLHAVAYISHIDALKGCKIIPGDLFRVAGSAQLPLFAVPPYVVLPVQCPRQALPCYPPVAANPTHPLI